MIFQKEKRDAALLHELVGVSNIVLDHMGFSGSVSHDQVGVQFLDLVLPPLR
jgi:hypothetical protein